MAHSNSKRKDNYTVSMSPDDFTSQNQSETTSAHEMDESTVHPDTAEIPIESTIPSAEETLPPEAQGEANGGPLGCCLGVVFGLLLGSGLVLGLSYIAYPLLKQTLAGGMNLTVRIIMFLAAIIGMIIFGQLGWRIGKKAYREYEPPVVKERGRQRQARLNVQARTTTRHRPGAKSK